MLLPRLGSDVDADTNAVFVGTPPLGSYFRTNWKTAAGDALAGKFIVVQATGPILPTDGVVQLKAGPELWETETNVKGKLTASVSMTFCASPGPAFATVMV